MFGAGKKTRPVEYASTLASEVLSGRQFHDLESVLRLGEPRGKRRSHKAVAVTEVMHGDDLIRLYIKKQWGWSRLLPRPRELIDGGAWQTDPEREWWGLQSLQSIGLSTAEPLALYRGPRIRSTAAVIVREVPSKHSLDDMLRLGLLQNQSAEQLELLWQSIVDTFWKIYRGGFRWRGVAAKHFFPEWVPSGYWNLWLIDCEGVHVRPSRRTLVRDTERLLNSLNICGLEHGPLNLIQKGLLNVC